MRDTRVEMEKAIKWKNTTRYVTAIIIQTLLELNRHELVIHMVVLISRIAGMT